MSGRTGQSRKLPHGFSIRLQAVYDTLKSAERKAADLLIDQPELVASASISDAARAAGCSEPTLTRLARKLGFTGFSDLKAELLNSIQQTGTSAPRPNLTEDPEQILSVVFQSSMRSLQDTLSVIDREQFAQAVYALAGAGRILAMGAGEAYATALTAEYRFKLAGMPCNTSSEGDMQLILASSLSEGDVLLIFSYSGRSRAMVSAARRAKAAGATVISVTNFPVSPLAKQTDILLLTAAFDELLPGDVTSRRLTQFAMLDSLFIAVMLTVETSVQEAFETNRNTIEASKQ